MRKATLLTPIGVAQKTTYVEWQTQPSLFKHYPAFSYRIRIADLPELEWIRQTRCVTDARQVGGKPYRRLNVPSAGNLHPIEMYVQCRNVKGVLDGIYHVDAVDETLVLIQEIERDGLEQAVGREKRWNGCIVLFSLVPFRSAWKYGLRGWRYVYLDLGHQIGAFLSVADYFDLPLTNLSVPDAADLSRLMGMDEDEFVAAAYAIGETSPKAALALTEPLMHVLPCDYTKRDARLIGAIREEGIYSALFPSTPWFWSERGSAGRRSAREFFAPIPDDAIRALMETEGSDSLLIVHCLLQAQTMQCGVYQSGRCIEEGVFTRQIVHLLLEQRFIAQASMVTLVYGKQFDAAAHVEAGIYVQRLYWLCETLNNVTCSGIGAFYDDEAVCWSTNPLLYAVAIGG